jgi:hypothetical protein
MTSVNVEYKRLCGSTEMGDDVPGDLVRFQVVFWLTSNINASYLHVSTVKVRRLSFSAAHKRNKGYNLTSPLLAHHRSQLLQVEKGWYRAITDFVAMLLGWPLAYVQSVPCQAWHPACMNTLNQMMFQGL